MTSTHVINLKISKMSTDIRCTMHEKGPLSKFTDNADIDQPVHLCRLILAFIACLKNEWILQYMSTNKDCPDQTAQIHPLIWTFALRIWQGFFTHVAHHMVNDPTFRTPKILTKWHMQTLQTQIRQLLRERSSLIRSFTIYHLTEIKIKWGPNYPCFWKTDFSYQSNHCSLF